MLSSLASFRSRSLARWCLVGGLAAVLPACSKGGAGDTASCRKLSDPLPGGPMNDRPIARSLYAELRSPGGSYTTVPLEGIGGSYSGSMQLTK